jgi:hypothetical protein
VYNSVRPRTKLRIFSSLERRIAEIERDKREKRKADLRKEVNVPKIIWLGRLWLI